MQTLFTWYGKRTVLSAFFIMALLFGAGFSLHSKSTEEVVETQEILPTVRVSTVASLVNESSLSLIGTVEAVNQASVQSEASGRIVAVRAALGDTVTAGSVLIQLENASQRAAVLQAEGVYESAIANASVSDVSLVQAQNNLAAANNEARNAIQTAYTTVSNGFFTQIDTMYRDPNSPLPSLFITDGNGQFLRNERKEFQTILPAWQAATAAITANTEISTDISDALNNVNRTRNLLDVFIKILQDRDNDTLNSEPVEQIIRDFNALRQSLDAIALRLQTSQTSLVTAAESVNQAELSGTNQNISVANAQVKQALGSLRTAEANLAKTIIRAPIAGEVNRLDVKVGDFVGQQTIVAEIANNNALEVTTFVGETDKDALEIGQIVKLDGRYDGVITEIANAINQATLKTEVIIATETEELNNGDTVQIEISGIEKAQNTTIFVPISAVKFTDTAGSVYTVADGKLEAISVELGRITGTSVEILSGITIEDQIVVDARGLVIGQKVEALTQ